MSTDSFESGETPALREPAASWTVKTSPTPSSKGYLAARFPWALISLDGSRPETSRLACPSGWPWRLTRTREALDFRGNASISGALGASVPVDRTVRAPRRGRTASPFRQSRQEGSRGGRDTQAHPPPFGRRAEGALVDLQLEIRDLMVRAVARHGVDEPLATRVGSVVPHREAPARQPAPQTPSQPCMVGVENARIESAASRVQEGRERVEAQQKGPDPLRRAPGHLAIDLGMIGGMHFQDAPAGFAWGDPRVEGEREAFGLLADQC